jgi:hypothetical protein
MGGPEMTAGLGRSVPHGCRTLCRDMEAVRMLMTPGERDLKNVVELCAGGLFVDEDAAPVDWADAPQDDP